MRNARYQIKRIDVDNEIRIILDYRTGKVLELDFDKASKTCQLWNRGATGGLRYELIVVHTSDKHKKEMKKLMTVEVEQIGIPEDPQFDTEVVKEEVFTKEDVGAAYYKGFQEGINLNNLVN